MSLNRININIFLAQQSNISFPLTGQEIGNKMVIADSNGQRVKLGCVNWYGFQLEDMIANGLDTQPLQTIVDEVRS